MLPPLSSAITLPRMTRPQLVAQVFFMHSATHMIARWWSCASVHVHLKCVVPGGRLVDTQPPAGAAPAAGGVRMAPTVRVCRPA